MRAIARNFILLTGTRVIDGTVRFLTVPLVLAYFGRSDFGLIALAFSMQAFLAVADFGFSMNAIRRFTASFEQQRLDEVAALARSAAFFYSGVGIVNLLALCVVGSHGASWFGLDARQADEFFWMMLALGISSVIGWSFSIHRQVLQAAGLSGWDEAVNLSATVLVLAGTVATLHWRFSPALYFAMVLFPSLLPMAARARKVRNVVPGLTIGFNPDWKLFRPLVGTSLLLFALMAAELFANHLRPLILAREAGLEQVAEFRILQQIAGFALMMLSGVMSVIYPSIARLDAANEHARINALLAIGSRLLLWGHLGLLVTLAFMSEAMLRVYVGDSFTSLAPALALWLLSLVAYHNAILSSVVIARGRLTWIVVGAVVNGIASLTLLHVLAPRHGVAGAIWAYTAYIGSQLVVMYLVSAPMAGAGSGWVLAARVLVRPVAAAVVSACVAILAVGSTNSPWWMGALVFAPLFLFCALTIGGASRDWLSLKHRPA